MIASTPSMSSIAHRASSSASTIAVPARDCGDSVFSSGSDECNDDAGTLEFDNWFTNASSRIASLNDVKKPETLLRPGQWDPGFVFRLSFIV
jgi:hypothetical protein